jgi:hypothetical protein
MTWIRRINASRAAVRETPNKEASTCSPGAKPRREASVKDPRHDRAVGEGGALLLQRGASPSSQFPELVCKACASFRLRRVQVALRRGRPRQPIQLPPGADRRPSAAATDSQSVRTTEAGGSRDYDAQGGVGPQAPRPHRHGWTCACAARPPGLRAEPRRRRSAARAVARPVPIIERAFADAGYAAKRVKETTLVGRRRVRPRESQAGRRRGAAPALGVQAGLGVAGPRPMPRPRLRDHQGIGNRLPLLRLRHAAHPKVRTFLVSSETDTMPTSPAPAR